MKISFDAQAFQSVNRMGGIGRYNRDFLKTLLQLYPQNQYALFYNGSYKSRDRQIPDFDKCEQQVVHYLPGNDLNPLNQWVQFFRYYSSRSDLIHVLSPFEDQWRTVIYNRRLPAKAAITIYDFIPFIFKEQYLSSAVALDLYIKRIKILETADLILSISEATCQDAINLFGVPAEKLVNIGLAASKDYDRLQEPSPDVFQQVKQRHGIEGDYVLTVSNLDRRKNLLALLQAFSALPDDLLRDLSLVVVTNAPLEYIRNNQAIVELIARNPRVRIKFVYAVSNRDLCFLYNFCSLFVYASLYEGGGLPVLEAMKCGAPVVASNSSSIPEYVGRTDNLFNPRDVDDITHTMANILTHPALRKEIALHGLEYSRAFTWENVARRAMLAYERILGR